MSYQKPKWPKHSFVLAALVVGAAIFLNGESFYAKQSRGEFIWNTVRYAADAAVGWTKRIVVLFPKAAE